MTPNVTLHRSTTLVIDAETYGIKCPGLALEREHHELARSNASQLTNVTHFPGIGWRLEAYQDTAEFGYENTAVASSAYLAPGTNATGATGLTELAATRKYSDVTPMSGGYAGSYPASAGRLWQVHYSASDTTPAVLTADQTAWPSPDANDQVTMERIIVGTANHAPSDAISVVYRNPSSFPTSSLLNVHFSGPAGVYDGGNYGLGEYCLKVKGNGSAELFERYYDALGVLVGWWKVFDYRWDTTRVHQGGVIQIVNRAKFTDSGWKGSEIQFFHTAIGSGQSVVETLRAAAEDAIRVKSKLPTARYVLRKTKDQHPTQVRPVRFDVRRDTRLQAAVQFHRYKTPGTIEDSICELGFIPSSGDEIEIDVFGDIPATTNVSIKLYDGDTDAEITASSTELIPPITGTDGRIAVFPLTTARRRVYAKVTMTSADGTATPTVETVRYVVSRTVQKITRTEKEGVPQRVSLIGPSDDPTVEGGTFDLHDPAGTLSSPLEVRDGMPCLLKTTYDSGGTNYSILARGYLSVSRRQVGAQRRGSVSTAKYGDGRWVDHKLTFLPEASRLDTAKTPKSFNYSRDPQDPEGRPFKVTSLIRELFKDAGYDSTQLDIEDLDLRFFANRDEDLYLDYRTPILEKVVEFARDYLGMFLIWDPNAGTGDDGMWRLVSYPRGADPGDGSYQFVAVAHFYTDIPTHSGIKAVHHQGSYPDTTNVFGNTIQTTYIEHGTLTKAQIKPEANVIEVWGIQPAAHGLVPSGPDAKLTATAYNFKSAHFFDGQDALMAPDPTSIDYLGYEVRKVFLDPGLTTEEAVKFVCRRLYNLLCHGRLRRVFRAPLLLITDENDSLQIRPRPLRFGDIVTIQGETAGTYFMVRSVSIDYIGDGRQMAWYEVEQPGPLESIAYTET